MRKLFTLRTVASVLFFLLIGARAIAMVGDAGVTAVPSPSNPTCKGTQPVAATIHNFGGITISAITVNWRVNGVVQTPYSFTGTINAGADTTVTIGNYNFTSGPYTVEVWSSDPNGSADANAANDSTIIVMNVSTALTGAYTVGGATPDYINFNAAVDALIANGVCGSVVFNMRPGTDTVQKIIPEITGASAANTITFQSQNNDSTSVTLTFPSKDTIPNNYLIVLNGADYFTFKAITLQRTGIGEYARIVEFTNNATHNTFTHCRVKGVVTTLPNSLAALMYSSNTNPTVYNDSVNTFTYNAFLNGSLAIYMNGLSSLQPESNHLIANNTFTDQYLRGVQMTNVAFAVIRENTFTTTSNYSGYAAVYLDRSLRPHMITKNKISGVPGTGIYLVDCIAQTGLHAIIANNFIHTNDSAGISMVNGDYQDVVFNSILMTGSTSTFSALSVRGTARGSIVKNNILANSGGGYAYVITDSAVFHVTSDYNDLFTSGGFVGNYNGTPRNNLASWRSASGRDSNSVSVNPNFATISDLHSTSIAMDDRGKPTSGITDDIDGDTRSALTPDIGADEYASVSRNVGVTALVTPADSLCGSATQVVSVIVSNTGGFPESNFMVHAQVSGAVTANLTQNHSNIIAPGTSDTITFATTINTSGGGTILFHLYTSLGVDDVHANDTLDVTIDTYLPPAAPTVTGASICGPGSDTLSAASGDSVRWYSASTGGTPIAYGPNFITPNVNTTTTYYAASVNACEGSRAPGALTVLPVPNVTLGNDTSIMQGQSLNINAGPGFASYLWSTTQVTQQINVNTTGCYWVRVTNGAGCADRDTICVTVVQTFDAGIVQVTSPSNHDCAGNNVPVMISVGNLGANSASNIPVTVQVSGIATATFHDTITNTIAAGNSVSLNMGTINTSAGGALVITAYTSYSADLDHTNDTIVNHDTIFIQPASPSGIGGSRCGAGTIVLISNSPTSDSVYWYDAASGGNLVFTGENYILPNQQTSVTYYAQTGQVCNNQDRTAVAAVINALPLVNLGPDATYNDSVVLDAGPYASFQWNDNSTNQTLTVTSSGTYSVCVVDANGCTNCDTVTLNIVVGIEPVSGPSLANLYPNPAHNAFTVTMHKSSQKVKMTMTDTQGQVIFIEESENLSSKMIDVSRFAKGVYNLQILTEEGTSVQRVIIQ